MTTVSFYLITAYTPTYGSTVLHLAADGRHDGDAVRRRVQFSWLPVMGALSDRIGRRPLLTVFTLLALVTAYPVMSWLVTRALVRPPAGRGAMVLIHLRQLQRRHGGLPHRDHAGEGPRLRLLARLQSRHWDLRRLYASHHHVPHPHDRQSRHAGRVVIVRRCVRIVAALLAKPQPSLAEALDGPALRSVPVQTN